jgi:hypothetical protein
MVTPHERARHDAISCGPGAAVTRWPRSGVRLRDRRRRQRLGRRRPTTSTAVPAVTASSPGRATTARRAARTSRSGVQRERSARPGGAAMP